MGCKIFELGAIYCATPALRGARQRLVIPIGRQGVRLQVVLVDDFSVADLDLDVAADYGREFGRLQLRDGSYSMSAACLASAEQLQHVNRRLGLGR